MLHSDSQIKKGCFKIVERPVVINHRILDPSLYLIVPDRISSLLASRKSSTNKCIFLMRNNNRIPQSHAGIAEHLFESSGFVMVRPEKLSLQEQITMMQTTDVIAGYAGSQLHNSMFCKKGATVISIGDTRWGNSIIPNQLMCDNLSEAHSFMIKYSPNVEQFQDNIHALLKTII
jgi:capsular polysaccharide biosynthesis protein